LELDLAVNDDFSRDVSILLGNGAGGFAHAPGSPIPVGSGPNSVAAADLDADGHLDLSLTDGPANRLWILLGNGAGGFAVAPGSPIALGSGPTFNLADDFNGDGRVDL